MNRDIDFKTAKIIKTDSLKKSGEQFALVSLSIRNIDAILALQDIIFDNLPEKQQSFILRKSREFFEGHLAAGNIVLGIVHNGQLVAQSVIVNPTENNPKTGMVDMALDAKLDKVTIIQGVAVHPDYRGNNLHLAMIGAWHDIAREQKRTHILGEVAVDNHYSWSNALKEGRQIHSIGVDPSDGTQVYNMHAKLSAVDKNRLKADFNKASAKNSVQCPHNDIEKQKKLLAEGYKGVRFDQASGMIEFKLPKARNKKPSSGGKHLP
jgi:hypothetical protein